MKPDDISPQDQKPLPVNEPLAEEHIVEIMGPAQRLDGSKPPESLETSEPAVSSAPEVDIDAINKELQAQVEGSAPEPLEADIDMNEPPAELSVHEADEVEVNQAVNDMFKPDDGTADAPEEDIPAAPPVVMKASFFERIKQAYYKWWDNRVLRFSTLGAVVVILGVAIFVPVVRNFLLNAVGARTSVSVTAVDGVTTMPLKNVVLKVADKSIKTGENGKAKLYGVKLGKQQVIIHKAGFADVKKDIDFSMRTIDLGEISLKATGTQYTFTVVDFLSSKEIKDVAISSGEATTKSDKTGKAVLTVPPTDDAKISVTVEKEGYRIENISVSADVAKPTDLKLVPAQKEVFVSRESGKYDVYKMDLDGKNKAVLLSGTGLETSSITISVDPSGKRAALVSTRDDQRNKDGYLLSALTLINIQTGDTETIEHAEMVSILGWSDTTLVYQQTVAGTSAANPSRNKITAYDYVDAKRVQVAAANYFSGAFLQGGKLYYVVSSTDPAVEGSFVRSNVDATNKKVLSSGQIWQLYRADYKTFKFQTPEKWYSYIVGNAAVQESTPLSDFSVRKYIDSTDGKLSAWVDDRDANGALMTYNVADGTDKQVTLQRGLTEVTRWVNNRVVIYRTVVSGEVTEYALSLDGGEPRKLTTVSALYQR